MKRNSAAIHVSQEEGAQPPFASYAQAVRMLMPLARKVAFHDETGSSLWASDGLEEAELTMQVQLLVDRYVNADPREKHLNDYSDLPEPVHVFPIRDIDGDLVGALAVQFDELPPTAAYRNYATVQRMLAPLLEILRHGWRPDALVAAPPQSPTPEPVKPIEPVAAPSASLSKVSAVSPSIQPPPKSEPTPPTALPAVLRRLLVEATEATSAAFGTIALPGHPFSFNHRRSEDESDLTVSTAVEVAHAQLLRWMTVRNEALIVNEHDPAKVQLSNYKLLALPVRIDAGPLLALVVLFRRRQEPAFVQDDLAVLQKIVERLPDTVLAELQRIHTIRALAVQYRPAPPSLKPVSKPVVKRAHANVSDAVAFILPAHVEDEPAADVSEPVPVVVGAPLPSLIERVRAALSKDAFELYAQRITPLHHYERPDRFEILLRMPDKYGMQTAAAFMSAAEAAGLSPTLDLWVIRRTLSMLRINNRLGREVRELSINLSAASLLDKSFVEQAIAEIHGSKLLPGQLAFEISEQVAMKHQEALRAFGDRLREAGCMITLDNCRIGLEIFALLPQWSVNCIKVDGSIIRELGISPAANSLIESIVQRAAVCGIESVAERVESPLACSTAISVGLDYAQGFHLEAPEPLAKLLC